MKQDEEVKKDLLTSVLLKHKCMECNLARTVIDGCFAQNKNMDDDN